MLYYFNNDELNYFKSHINLVNYAQELGYCVIPKESTSNSIKLKSLNQTIIISKANNNHYIYYNATTNKCGTIIDFLKEHKNYNLGKIRQELKKYLGHTASSATIINEKSNKKNVEKQYDLTAIKNKYSQTQAISCHSYLLKRGISQEIQNSSKFQGKIRVNQYNTLVFPYYNKNGLCGFELKSINFKGFCKGGEKGLWASNNITEANKIVIVESVLDALSYEQLHGSSSTAYIGIGGQVTYKQLNLLKNIFEKYQNSQFISCVDNDLAGEKLHQKLLTINTNLIRKKSRNKDFNEDLMEYLEILN